MRNPFAGRPPLQTLRVFLLTGSIASAALTVGFMADSKTIAITTLAIAVTASVVAWPSFRALRNVGVDLADHPDAPTMHAEIKLYGGAIAVAMVGLLVTHFVRLYALGHRHDMVPWWGFYFLTVFCLNPLGQQLRPPKPPRITTWRDDLKPLHSDHWGQA